MGHRSDEQSFDLIRELAEQQFRRQRAALEGRLRSDLTEHIKAQLRTTLTALGDSSAFLPELAAAAVEGFEEFYRTHFMVDNGDVVEVVHR